MLCFFVYSIQVDQQVRLCLFLSLLRKAVTDVTRASPLLLPPLILPLLLLHYSSNTPPLLLYYHPTICNGGKLYRSDQGILNRWFRIIWPFGLVDYRALAIFLTALVHTALSLHSRFAGKTTRQMPKKIVRGFVTLSTCSDFRHPNNTLFPYRIARRAGIYTVK